MLRLMVGKKRRSPCIWYIAAQGISMSANEASMPPWQTFRGLVCRGSTRKPSSTRSPLHLANSGPLWPMKGPPMSMGWKPSGMSAGLGWEVTTKSGRLGCVASYPPAARSVHHPFETELPRCADRVHIHRDHRLGRELALQQQL